MPGDTTVEKQGTRFVPICTTDHDKAEVTAVLAVMANGKKLKPFVMLKGFHPVAEINQVPGVAVALSSNGWR